ncbi:unnamed protein product [Diplocarpon coronariae]
MPFSLPSPPLSINFSTIPLLIASLLTYVVLCSALRYQRRDAKLKKYGFTDREAMRKMSNVEAQKIIAYLAELEFPKLYFTSVQFALFKTYGIPTISGLLVATREFSTPENASKRYADTGVLIQEFVGHHPKSPRVIKALARMNYIHSRYQKAGKISNSDLLYTLSVFITEPISWVERYEWRAMNDMEICAIGTFWKSIGDAMGIVYDGALAKSEWEDGIAFYEDIKMWAEGYERDFMMAATPNKITADELIPLLLFYLPQNFKAAGKHMVGVLMGERLRAAMMHPTPPATYFQFVNAVFGMRRFFLRYLALPRPEFMRVRELSDTPDPKTGRYHTNRYQAHPFYNKPTFLSRWGPEGWFVWASGGDVPGSKGDLYIPEGYKFEEVGPKGMKNRGTEEMKTWEEKLEAERPAGCPFAFGQAILTQALPSWSTLGFSETHILAYLLHDIGTMDENITATLLSVEFYGWFLALGRLKLHEAPIEQAENVAEVVIRHQDLGGTGTLTRLGGLVQLATVFDMASASDFNALPRFHVN